MNPPKRMAGKPATNTGREERSAPWNPECIFIPRGALEERPEKLRDLKRRVTNKTNKTNKTMISLKLSAFSKKNKDHPIGIAPASRVHEAILC
jgi:hypothetical protein